MSTPIERPLGTVMTPRRLKAAFWVLGAGLLLVGAYGVYDRLAFGHLHANYGSVVTWGLWVAAYIYIVGLSAGSFLISSLVYVFNVKRFEQIGRLAVFVAAVTLLLALLSISFDLGHMDRAWHVLIWPNFKSPMAWMIWLYTAYFIVLLAEFWFLLRADLVRGARSEDWRAPIYRLLALGSRDASEAGLRRDMKVVKVLATIGVPLAIMFHGGVGALFGVVVARPHWNSGMFPVLFLISALVSGGALLTVAAVIFQDGWRRNRETVLALGRVVMILLLLDLVFQVSELLIIYRGGTPGDVAGMNLVMTGPYWWVFWAWQVLLGTAIPLLLLVLPTRNDPRWVALAALLIAAGLFGLRLNIVIPGLAVEELKGLAGAVASLRANPTYFPSPSEWFLTFGIAGLGLLLFGLGELVLPMSQHPRE